MGDGARRSRAGRFPHHASHVGAVPASESGWEGAPRGVIVRMNRDEACALKTKCTEQGQRVTGAGHVLRVRCVYFYFCSRTRTRGAGRGLRFHSLRAPSFRVRTRDVLGESRDSFEGTPLANSTAGAGERTQFPTPALCTQKLSLKARLS